jgi:hypothetical protein
MKRYILFVIPIVLTLIVSVTIGGLAFARSDIPCDGLNGNPLQQKCKDEGVTSPSPDKVCTKDFCAHLSSPNYYSTIESSFQETHLISILDSFILCIYSQNHNSFRSSL